MKTHHRIKSTVLLVLTIFSLFAPGVLAVTTYLENFDDDEVGANPTSDFYTYAESGSGSAGVSSLQSLSPPNSFRYSDTGGLLKADFTLSNDASAGLCLETGFEIQFSVYFTRFPAASGGAWFLTIDEAVSLNNGRMGILIGETGAVQPWVILNSGAAVAATSPKSLVTNTWYDIRLTDLRCGNNGGLTVFFPDDESSATVSGTTGAAVLSTTAGTNYKLSFHRETILGGTETDRGEVFIDNFVILGEDPEVPALATSATYADIVGFAVDDEPSNVIIRTDAGDNVRTLSATSLSEVAMENTDCTGIDNVMAQKTNEGPLVSYFWCEGGSGSPTQFRIRNGGLLIPELSGCGAACASLATGEWASEDDDLMGEFGEVSSVPIDWSVNSPGATIVNPDTWKMAFTFTGTASRAGQVGVFVYTNCQIEAGCDDDGRTIRINYANSLVEDICTSTDNGQVYMAAVDAGSPTKVFPFSFSNETVGARRELRAQFGVPASFTGVATNAQGVACAGSKIAVVTASKVSLWNRTGIGSPLWTPIDCSCSIRGVALSEIRPNGDQWLAYIDGTTTIRIVNAITGEKVGRLTFTAGGIVGTEMDRYGSYVIMSTDTLVKVWDISVLPEIGPVGQPGSDTPPTVTSPEGFVGAVAALADALNVNEVVAGAILGLILMLLMAIIGFIAFGGIKRIREGRRMGDGPVFGAGVFASVMFMINGVIGLFTPYIIFGVFLLVGAAVWLRRAI